MRKTWFHDLICFNKPLLEVKSQRRAFVYQLKLFFFSVFFGFQILMFHVVFGLVAIILIRILIFGSQKSSPSVLDKYHLFFFKWKKVELLFQFGWLN